MASLLAKAYVNLFFMKITILLWEKKSGKVLKTLVAVGLWGFLLVGLGVVDPKIWTVG